MKSQTAERVVKAAAVINALFGVVTLVSGWLSVTYLFVSFASFLSAWLLWRRKERLIPLFLSWFLVLAALSTLLWFSVSDGPGHELDIIVLLALLYTLISHVFVVYFIGFQSDVKGLFKQHLLPNGESKKKRNPPETDRMKWTSSSLISLIDLSSLMPAVIILSFGLFGGLFGAALVDEFTPLMLMYIFGGLIIFFALIYITIGLLKFWRFARVLAIILSSLVILCSLIILGDVLFFSNEPEHLIAFFVVPPFNFLFLWAIFSFYHLLFNKRVKEIFNARAIATYGAKE